MRINRLKISGFKSFVDPITLTLPGNLTGVVGPNGCGKSNIIDALIWVMGESSAKHLRGDSMSDVIFNGSNTRKPVGQAMVEIIFDNTDGTIGGQYAGFGEISIKRTMSRDAVSSYFLNGARCRRKDITNVFLGTGIGARGYSVIEQGMISRVIEARPEELRAFLEEAAGISKYKERRRETENRMRHARENIERLDDIREELAKQLNHLQRQARAAERYQVHKAEERRLNGRLICARWRKLELDQKKIATLSETRKTELEAEIARLREVEAKQTEFRESQIAATEAFNKIQAEFYAHSGDIARLEQAIRHNDERQQALQHDLLEAQRAVDELDRGSEAEGAELSEISNELLANEPNFTNARDEEEKAYEKLQSVEQKFAQWQQDWDEFNRQHSALAQQDHAVQIRLEHLLSTVAGHDSRKLALSEEAERNETADLGAKVAQLSADLEQVGQQREKLSKARTANRESLSEHRGELTKLGAAVHEQQLALEEQRGRYASLKALQDAAYGGDQEALEQWLAERGVSNPARLAEFIEIEAGWESALEAALRLPLGAICGEGISANVLRGAAGAQAEGRITAFDLASPNSPAQRATMDSRLLASRVSGRVDLAPLLDGVYTADNLASAESRRAGLAANEMIVLPDGTLIARDWVQLADHSDASESILARERQLVERAAQLEKLDTDTSNSRHQLDAAQQRYNALEQEEQRVVEELENANRDYDNRRNELGQMEAELQRRQARAADVMAELERIANQSNESQLTITQLRSERDSAQQTLQQHAEQRQALTATRGEIQAEVDSTREAWRELRERAHSLELRIQQLKSRREALDAAKTRNTADRAQLAARTQEIQTATTALAEPKIRMAEELEQALGLKLEAENSLTSARQELGALDQSLQTSVAQKTEIEQAIQLCQQRLEQVRLDLRALEVRMQELVSRFGSTGENFEQTLAELTDDDDEASVEAALEKVANRIARLGPINLAAIDEFNQLSERKTYLDQQHGDLTDALTTLEEAIRKIDRETRTRFKETYDKVNNGLQAMFPVLFGGGHAYLEMTGDDLLETGVTVMARPPGKRNSTIHLLSGGEKALTALSFVFSIFELNPAPFCLLDEVDAPLDDANVVRLTEMLKTMASNIQFVFISHNKITMEIAEQLVGVTMQEAGVSRLVSVNMEQAVELAQSA